MEFMVGKDRNKMIELGGKLIVILILIGLVLSN